MSDVSLPDNSDPRRTEVGNRIDPSLARGFVKQIVERAQQQIQLPKPKDLGHFRNQKARMRAILRLRQNNAKRLVAAVASPDYYLAEMVMLHADEVQGKRRIGAISARFDFHEQTKIPATQWEAYPMQRIANCAFLSEHAMIRLVQRAGATTFEHCVSLMRSYWAWAGLAHDVGQEIKRDFYWFCPVPTGLFAVSTDTSLTSSGYFTVSTARTYIDKSDMRPVTQEVWTRLNDAGALRDIPKFPRLSLPTSEQAGLFGAMCSEGAKWVRRHDYAVSRQEEKDLFAGED